MQSENTIDRVLVYMTTLKYKCLGYVTLNGKMILNDDLVMCHVFRYINPLLGLVQYLESHIKVKCRPWSEIF